jgi:hypothetical protein
LLHGGERELQGVFFSIEADELRQCHAPRLADGRRSSRERRVFEMRQAREPSIQASLEELSAPDGAVHAVAGPVEGDPDDALFCGTFVVSEAARDVRVVVLDADSRESGFLELTGVLGGQVLGMEVVGDQFRTNVEEP